jgi:hypothetical protein
LTCQVDVQGQAVLDIGCAMWFSSCFQLDGEGQFPIGDVRQTHLLDIHNAPAFRAAREHRATRIGGAHPVF